MDEVNKLIGFGPDALWTFLGVAIGIGIIVKLALDLVLKIKELRKPKVEDEKTIAEKLRNDNKRLNDLEEQAKKQDKEMKLLLRSQIAMIHHMLDGNNTLALQKSQQEIENFLIEEA